MIEWKKSAELNNCTVDELKKHFKRFPGSEKKIVAICDGCEKERILNQHNYKKLCLKCKMNTGDMINMNRERGIGNDYALGNKLSPETRMKMSIIKKCHKPTFTGPHTDESNEKNRQSNLKRYTEMDDPKQQIVGHHIAYDFDRPDAFVVQMTRSFHAKIHNPKGQKISEHGYSLID
jgi:hypothetical protein